MNIEHQRVNSIGDLKRLRLVYLDSLIHQQELYLELMVQKSKYYIIKVEDSLAGYFILYQDKTIVEFYLDNHHVKDDQAIFKEIIQSLKVKSIISKSYDHLLMKLSIEQFRTSKALGYLFRDDIQHRDFSQDESVTTRKAEKQDLPHIVKLKEGVFESNEEIVSYIDKKKILIFEKGDRLLGFGIHSRTVEDRDGFDIGVAVVRSLRGKGIGSYIIKQMKNLCYKNGWIPTCGCDIDNIASKKCLEKAGFISKYILVEFSDEFIDRRTSKRNIPST